MPPVLATTSMQRTLAERGSAAIGSWIAKMTAEQEGRIFLWSPLALICGIWAFFGLAAEPPQALAYGLAFIMILLLWRGRSSAVALLLALAIGGFLLAKARSELVATPLLRATTGEVQVTGQVISVERASASRLIIILAPDAIEGLAAARKPLRLRLSSTGKFGLPITGTRVTLKGRLAPLPEPVMPGGFDYGRHLWFEGIGGIGRVTAEITTIDSHVPLPAQFAARLSTIRAAMGARIHAAIDEPYASFAEALITGERSTIPKDMNQSLMASGLFHILSISGLHMWLVAGGVFWTVRAGLALFPALALAYPIKKWAAAAALAMGLFYMLLADSGVATQRSYIMIAVAFLAVIADRPALSIRTLAIAALIVLAVEPEAAVEASFQMSFLAVLGLVALFEAWTRWRASADHDGGAARTALTRLARWLVKAAAVSLATTLVAGSMSSIPAVYHFGRLSPYSLIANGLAIPVVGLVVMPSALLAAVLMPLGLEAIPLAMMNEGLRLVLAISDWVAGFPGSGIIAPQPSLTSALVLGTGAVCLCLLAGSARLVAFAVVLIGLVLSFLPREMPDLLIERSGQNVALRGSEGLLVPAQPRRGSFSVEKWLQANGEEAKLPEAAKRNGWTCSGGRCSALFKGHKILYFSKLEGQAIDCGAADVVIADFPLRGACREAELRIDRFDLWKRGAHAVTFTPQGTRVETARGLQGRRPWVVEPERRATPYRPEPARDVSSN